MSSKHQEEPAKVDRAITVVVVPDRGRRTRTFRISRRSLRWLMPLTGLLGTSAAIMVGSWGYLAVQANRARFLEAEVARLEARAARVEALAESLAEVEAAYEGLRGLFGPEAAPGANELWLPPATGRVPVSQASRDADGDLPTSWPLTERGFITQAALADTGPDHPGVDIAVPAGSYVRASARGAVLETGNDPVYGNFVLIDHGMGYRSLYAHLSLVLASEGDPVRRHEVIALSGSTGRSTAPHLHFEIHSDGDPVDPLALVAQP